MNLTRFDNNGLELVIDQTTGEVFASQRALARMVGVVDTTIMRWATAALITTKEAETPTTTGFKAAALFDEDAIYKAFAKYKPELLIQCAKAGIRIYLHRLAGFEITSSATKPVPSQSNLPINKQALEVSRDIKEIQDNLINNPRLAQFLIDVAISDLMPSQHLLTGDRLRGVAEIAKDMGYPVTDKNRSQLGRFVKAACPDLAQPEERLVNGIMTKVYCYPENDKSVRQAIMTFFKD